ncbi:MAG: hypothetical protein WC119_00440 [Synergistaceae bacterium]
MENQYNLSDDDIGDLLTGYADGERRVMQETGMEIDEIEEWGLNHNIEKCPTCGCWTESHNLLPDEPDDSDEPDGFCDNCR